MLACEPMGTPRPKVEWEKNGKPISSSGFHYHVHDTGTLEFSSVKVKDAADYTCLVNNEAGSLSKSFTVEVLG